MDRIDRERRSRNMSRIRGRDTRIELTLRRALWAQGVRGYRVDHKKVTGRPDVTFSRWKVAVFTDSCFWHVCPQHFVPPSSNQQYWEPKLERNRKRDEAVSAALTADGWAVVRLWEHEVESDATDCVNRVKEALADAGWVSPQYRRGCPE